MMPEDTASMMIYHHTGHPLLLVVLQQGFDVLRLAAACHVNLQHPSPSDRGGLKSRLGLVRLLWKALQVRYPEGMLPSTVYSVLCTVVEPSTRCRTLRLNGNERVDRSDGSILDWVTARRLGLYLSQRTANQGLSGTAALIK